MRKLPGFLTIQNPKHIRINAPKEGAKCRFASQIINKNDINFD